MKVLSYESRDEWLAARRGKITGSTAGDVVVKGGTIDQMKTILTARGIEFPPKAKKEELETLLTPDMRAELMALQPKKKAFYQLIADRISMPRDEDEDPMDRGSRLEAEAVERFCEETGKTMRTDLVMWVDDENPSIAVSPDAFEDVPEGEPITEAVEVKCLASATHIQAFMEQEIPSDYEEQVLQYFIVNPHLQRLFFVMMDPDLIVHDFFFITIERAEVEERIAEIRAYQQLVLREVDDLVAEWTF